jgi:hypothetical protein
MSQRSDLLEQLSTAKRLAETAESNMQAHLDTYVSGMVVGNAMSNTEDAIKTLELTLQSHLADVRRILDQLDELPL